MPEPTAETALDLMAHTEQDGAAIAPLTGFRNLSNGRFEPGNQYAKGRLGARKAAMLLDRAAPKITKRLIAQAFKSDRVLMKAADKCLPDAGHDAGTPLVSIQFGALE